MALVTQALWFARDMQAALRFYTALIPGSAMGPVWTVAADTPSGPPGAVEVCDFTLGDQRYRAMQAGTTEAFNNTFSIAIACKDQAELDRMWDALAEGGTVLQCGWLQDRWGLSWQIMPDALIRLMADPDQDRAARVAQAMMSMVKFDIAALERAAG